MIDWKPLTCVVAKLFEALWVVKGLHRSYCSMFTIGQWSNTKWECLEGSYLLSRLFKAC